jgi:capsular exopolysaccharide synthesis family protein
LNSPHSSIREFLAVVRQHRWLVLVCVLVFGGGAYALSERATPNYRAEAALSCRPSTQTVELIGLISPRDETPEQRAAVCAERAGRQSLLTPVAKDLRLTEPAGTIAARVEARAETRTNLVVLTVEDSDPVLAARIANGLAREVVRTERRSAQHRFDDLIRTTRREYRRALSGEHDAFARFRRRELREQLAKIEAARDFTRPVEIADRATVPTEPFSPKTTRNVVLGLAAGLLIGLMGAFLRSALDRRLRRAEDIEAEAGLPMLGSIRDSAMGHANFGDPDGRGDSERDLEAFRILHTNLAFMDLDRPLKRILVTSAAPEEGKSTVASSLAIVAGLAGRDVLLVESDLRRPVLSDWLGIERSPGLSDYLTGKVGPSEAVTTVALHKGHANGSTPAADDRPGILSVMTAGTPPPRPAELLRSARFGDFSATAAHAHDLVIFDAPPLLPVTDALDLVPHVDAVLLCVRARRTTREALRAAAEALRRLPERPAGYVVTGVTSETEGDYGSYGYVYGLAGR